MKVKDQRYRGKHFDEKKYRAVLTLCGMALLDPSLIDKAKDGLLWARSHCALVGSQEQRDVVDGFEELIYASS